MRSNLRRITGKAFLAYSVVMAAVVAAFLLLACGGGDGSSTDGSGELSGSIVGDGSSTVFPITEAVAEEFRKDSGSAAFNLHFHGTRPGSDYIYLPPN